MNLDALQTNTTLMELYRIQEEERLRQQEWLAFVGGSYPTPGLLQFSTMASYIEVPSFRGDSIVVNEVELERIFYKYFNTQDYMES